VNKLQFFPIEETYPRDLFGEPVQPGRGQSGRPRHVPTSETRARVAELRAEGLSIAQIARELGLSQPTLQLNYPIELGSGSTVWRRRVAGEAGDCNAPES
jgi:AraC-like DNA-binding protein